MFKLIVRHNKNFIRSEEEASDIKHEALVIYCMSKNEPNIVTAVKLSQFTD